MMRTYDCLAVNPDNPRAQCLLRAHRPEIEHYAMWLERGIPRVLRWRGEARLVEMPTGPAVEMAFPLTDATSEAAAIALLHERPEYQGSVGWTVVNGNGGWVGRIFRRVMI